MYKAIFFWVRLDVGNRLPRSSTYRAGRLSFGCGMPAASFFRFGEGKRRHSHSRFMEVDGTENSEDHDIRIHPHTKTGVAWWCHQLP